MRLHLLPSSLVLVAAIVLHGAAGAAPAVDAQASAAAWARDGRLLPEPEVLQPRLDPDLPAYQPCSAQPLRGSIEGSVPAILPKLVHRWAAAFQARQPDVRISAPPPYLAPQGSLSPPMQKFLDGGSDFAFVSRDMAASDIAAFRRAHGVAPQAIPVAGGAWRHFGFVDAVAVVVNDANPLRGVTLAQLDAVFSSSRLRGHGPVRTWGDLGVTEWADKPVHVVGAASWKGAQASARAIVVHERVLSLGSRQGQWRDDVMANGTEADVPGQVAADPYAIGFTGMGHLVAGIKTVPLAQEAGGPPVDASYENVALARYPLSRVAHIVLARVAGRPLEPALREFVRFILSREGQQIVLDQGVMLPLRAVQVEAARRLLGANGDPGGC
ncbi:PstS family phosphate ABC transporter substrate-binding protein [Polaromonas jejuensis]|uniref:PstS family phosphate ABC transporter substrate-binding protein n=1 Tax=Polaromonas jejuensis TaxID=457502 RepID=A0ABW0Q7J5_9BURK|nr:substrate-binding domain-containing protein [Polaromonas jejuensis]